MKYAFLIAVCVTILTLAACKAPPALTPDEIAHDNWMKQNAERDVICSDNEDCEIKWTRAIEWVYKNSAFKIRTVSHHIIDTAGPNINVPYYRFTVIKKALGKGQYVINLIIHCHDESCKTSYVATSNFVSAVMDGKESPALPQ